MTYATLEKQIRALPEECLDEVSLYRVYFIQDADEEGDFIGSG